MFATFEQKLLYIVPTQTKHVGLVIDKIYTTYVSCLTWGVVTILLDHSGMQNVNGGRCAGPDCSKQPRFSMPGEKGKYCSKHREDGMVDVLYTVSIAQKSPGTKLVC